jgi:hypothetical protein
MTGPTRRDVLALLGAAATGLGATAAVAAPASGLPSTLRAVGEAWLTQHPADRALGRLETALAPLLDRAAADRPDALSALVRSDFAAGAARWIDGLLVADTEARLCALLVRNGEAGA